VRFQGSRQFRRGDATVDNFLVTTRREHGPIGVSP
jgi:hypothetical protein